MANSPFQVRHGLVVNNTVLVANTTTGNVGIGTSNPQYTLDVTGDARITGNLTLGDSSTDTVTVNAANFNLANNVNFDSGTLFIDAQNNRVGIGTTSPGYKLNVAGDIVTTGVLGFGGFTNDLANIKIVGGDWYFQTNNYNLKLNANYGKQIQLLGHAGVLGLAVTTDGNVGVGTSTPQQKLDVNGKVRIRNDGTTDNDTQLFGAVGDGSTESWSLKMINVGSGFGRGISLNTRDARDPILLHANSANPSSALVGIGLSTLPTSTLDVNGTVNALAYKLQGTQALYVTSAGSGYNISPTLGTQDSRDYILLQPSGGNVGIGTTSPTAKLHVAGDAIFTGNVTVSGNTSYMNTQTLLIGDNLITLNADLPVGSPATEDAGIEVNRGSSGNSSIIWNETGDRWDVRANNNTYVTITESGRVGIGTDTPSYPLQVAKNVGDAIQVSLFDGTGGGNRRIEFNPYSNRITAGVGGSYYTSLNFMLRGFYVTDDNTGNQVFNVNNGVARINEIDSGGVAGVAYSPLTLFSNFYPANSTAPAIYLSTFDTGGGAISRMHIYNGDSGKIVLQPTAGNVGIGTSSPVAKLHVVSSNSSTNVSSTAVSTIGPSYPSSLVVQQSYNGANTFSAISFYNTFDIQSSIGAQFMGSGYGASGELFFNTRSPGGSGTLTERMRISAWGNVGIGTSTPLTQLQVVNANDVQKAVNITTGLMGYLGQTDNTVLDKGVVIGNNLGAGIGGYITPVQSSAYGYRGITLDSTGIKFSIATGGTTAGALVTLNPQFTITTSGTTTSISTGSGRQNLAGFFAGPGGSGNGASILIGSTQTTAGYISGIETINNNTGDLIFGTQSAGYVERMRIVGATGNVGIANTAPEARLHVYGANNASTALKVTTPGSDNAVTRKGVEVVPTGGPNSTYYGFYADVTGHSANYGLYINNGRAYIKDLTDMLGNARITGVRDSNYGTLQIGDTTSGSGAGLGGRITFWGDTVGQGSARNAFAGIKGVKENSSYLNLLGALIFETQTDNSTGDGTTLTEKMRITANGNVGIGTSSPTAKLHVYANTPSFIVQSGNSNDGSIRIKNSGSTDMLSLYTNSGGDSFIESFGTLTIQSGTGAGTNPITFKTAYATRMTIDLNGRVAIGPQSPTARLDVSDGTSTSNTTSLVNLTQTWNNSGNTFTAIQANITDTASATGSILMDLKVTGNSKFKVDKTGNVYVGPNKKIESYPDEYNNYTSVDFGSVGSGSMHFWQNGSNLATAFRWNDSNPGVRVRAGYGYTWTSGSAASSAELGLYMEGAGVLAQRLAGSTLTPQKYNLYGTYTDGANYERLSFSANSTAAYIQTENAGTGIARSLRLGANNQTVVSINADKSVGIKQTLTGRSSIDHVTYSIFEAGVDAVYLCNNYNRSGPGYPPDTIYIGGLASDNFSRDLFKISSTNVITTGALFQVVRPAVDPTVMGAGALQISRGIGTNSLGIGTSANDQYAWLQYSLDYVAKNIVLNPVGGNVGIGTTSPATQFHQKSLSANNYNNKIFRIDSNTDSRIATVTGDGRVFIGSDNGYNVVFSVDNKGEKKDSSYTMLIKDSYNLLMASSGFVTDSPNFSLGANNFGATIEFVSPAQNGMLTINKANTSIGRGNQSGTPDKTLRVYTQLSLPTTFRVQESDSQGSVESFGVYANNDSTARLVVANGRVGVGTSSPSYLFHLSSSSTSPSGDIARFESPVTSGGFTTVSFRHNVSGGADVTTAIGADGTKGWVGTTSNTDFALFSNFTEKMRITSGGNVGIGTTSPATLLQVKSTKYVDSSCISIYTSDGGYWDNATGTVRINPAGSSGLAQLGVMNSAGFDIDWISDSSGTKSATLKFSPNGVVLNGTSGNTSYLGIGTTTPTAKLDANTDIIRIRTSKTPASATATGNQGDICWDSNYIYVCTSANTWVRANLSSW